MSLHCEGSRLILPVRKPHARDETLPSFGVPGSAQPVAKLVQHPGEPPTGETSSRVTSDAGTVLHFTPHDHFGQVHRHFHRAPRGSEHEARYLHSRKIYARRDWRVRLAISATMRALRDVCRLETRIVAHDGEELVLERDEVKEFTRDLN